MGRWAEVLLVAMLVLSIAFARQAEAIVKQYPVSASWVAPLSVYDPVQSDTSDTLAVNPMSETPFKIPSHVIADFHLDPSCTLCAHYQRRLVEFNNGENCFLVKWDGVALLPDGRTGSSFIAPLLRSFDSFSPPGLIMRL